MDCGSLIEAVSRIEPGDLLAAVAAMDEANHLVEKSVDEDRSVKELLLHVVDKMSLWIRDGFSENHEAERDDIVSALKGLQRSHVEDEDDADYDLVISFVAESRSHLDDIESRLLAMEDASDPEAVNGVFRSIHTIKGVSSFLGLPKVKTLSHALETILDEVRNGGREVTSNLIDILLAGSDRLTAFVDALEIWTDNVNHEHPGVLEEPDVPIEDIMDRLGRIDESESPAVQPAKAVESPVADMPLFTPEMVRNFVNESSDIIDTAEKALMDLDDGAGKESLDEAFRGVHTIKGNAGFFGFDEICQFCQSLETVMDGMRRGEKNIGSGTITGLLDGLDSLRNQMSALNDSGSISQVGASVPPQEKKGEPRTSAAGEPPSLGEVLIDMGAVKQEDVDSALDSQSRRLGEILVERGVVDEGKVQAALAVQSSKGKTTEGGGSAAGKRDVRVDTARLDHLFTLIGELITAHAMVVNSPDLLSLELPDFDKAASDMGKIIRDVQTLSMSIRMIPLDGLFSKMRRLTRDLSRKFGKTVDFRSRGEDTEMDRQIIEQISDPLVHLVRNAIDHGLESAEKRRAVGKNPNGQLELAARYEGNEVWISLKDDGGGLSRERILSRAVERGMDLGDDNGASLEDKAVWSLIFEAGFSTAQEVSDVSGRGVGMDVVRQNIEKLRGQVRVDSFEGTGTEITLQIPMTLAIIDGIAFRAGGILFAMPIADILEFHRADGERITRSPSGRKILRLREHLLPVVTLESFYDLGHAGHDGTESVYVIVGSGDKQAAVPADEILGNRQLVIKSLPERLRGVRALSGCAIMGNGDVCLILDVGAMLTEELTGALL